MFFRKRKFPMVGGAPKVVAPEVRPDGRDPSGDYDHRWTELSLKFRKKNPFCRFCEQDGYECSLADDVDHIIPIEDGGDRLSWENLQSLCKKHHYGRKARLQRYARDKSMIEMLPKWCADPSSRPDFTVRAK